MSIIQYNYAEISSVLTKAQTLIQGITDKANEVQKHVDSFPWEDETSAAHFKNTATIAVKSAQRVADDFLELRQAAGKANSSMQEFNDSVAKQWS